jgi:hypothetical protein
MFYIVLALPNYFYASRHAVFTDSYENNFFLLKTGSRTPVFQCKLSICKRQLWTSGFFVHFKHGSPAHLLFTVFIVFSRGQDLSGVPGYPLANSLQSVRSLALPDCRLTTEQLTALFRNEDLKPSVCVRYCWTSVADGLLVDPYLHFKLPFYLLSSRLWPRMLACALLAHIF